MRSLCCLLAKRFIASNASEKTEQLMHNLLSKRFPEALVKITDVSGGCGAMFEIFVEDKEFTGMTTLKQHQLVTNVLREQIKEMHGLRIHTSTPKEIP